MMALSSLIGAFLSATCILCAQQKADTDSITVCGVRLQLGMAQASTMQRLSTSCNTREIGKDGTAWLLRTKEDPSIHVGSVIFRQKKLWQIAKNWASESSSASDLAETVYFAFRHFAEEGRTDCTIQTQNLEEPDIAVKNMFVSCGRKDILIVLSKSRRSAPSVSVSELLGEP
jgi:membrane-bound lytic murein transglycosylase